MTSDLKKRIKEDKRADESCSRDCFKKHLVTTTKTPSKPTGHPKTLILNILGFKFCTIRLNNFYPLF